MKRSNYVYFRRAFCWLGVVGCFVCGCDISKHSYAELKGVPEPVAQAPTTTFSSEQLSRDSLRAVRRDMFVDGTGSADYTFGKIVGVAVDKNRNTFVLDQLKGDVRKYSSSGAFLSRFSRRGEGPGELANPRGMTLSGDTIFILDRALQLFDTAGLSMGSIVGDNYDFGSTYTISSSGGMIGVVNIGFTLGKMTTMTDTFKFRVFDLSNRTAATPSISIAQQRYRITGGLRYPQPLSLRDVLAISHNGTVFRTVGDSFRIEVLDIHGSLKHRILGSPPRIRTRPGDVEQSLATILDQFEHDRLVHPASVSTAYRNITPVPFRPVFRTGIASDQGALLLERVDIEVDPYDGKSSSALSVWLLIGPDFHPLGHIRLPRRFTPMVFRGCDITGVIADADDVQSVARYVISSDGPWERFICDAPAPH